MNAEPWPLCRCGREVAPFRWETDCSAPACRYPEDYCARCYAKLTLDDPEDSDWPACAMCDRSGRLADDECPDCAGLGLTPVCRKCVRDEDDPGLGG